MGFLWLRVHVIGIFLLLFLAAGLCRAGGGPQHVVIVVNTRSQESLEIGNAYRRARGIPYRQVVQLNTSTAYAVSADTYRKEIETPILAFLKDRQLEDEVTTLVLTRGVPQMVTIENGRATASLLAASGLDKSSATARLANPFLGSAVAFVRRTPATRGMFLVTALQGYSTRDIQALIKRGVAADGTAPDGRFVLQTSAHIPLATHAAAQDILAARNLKVEVLDAPPQDKTGLMAYLSGGIFSGLTRDLVASCAFRPGALVDIAQPFGAARNNVDESEPPILLPIGSLIQAGATGAHSLIGDGGMDSIPTVGNQSQLLDRYASGLSLAESFYAALPFLNWQNVIIGDPLCAPYAQRPTITVNLPEEPCKGIIPIRVTAASPVAGVTVSRIDLYLDETFATSIYQPEKTRIQLRINEQAASYTLPDGATRRTLLDGLAEAINNHPILQSPNGGVRAVTSLNTGTLQLIARTPGVEGNDIPVSISIENEDASPSAVTARMDGSCLSGGGLGPTPARATLSFVGRKLKPGDTVTLTIQQEVFTYTVPEENATLNALLDALVSKIESSTSLQHPTGVHAYRGASNMPFIILEARTPGDSGNDIPVQLTIKTMEGSQLRGYPNTPSFLTGGKDGSAASAKIQFILGETTAKGTYLLNTATLADGYHRLRIVAYDGSPAQVQGVKDVSFTVANQDTPVSVMLPDKLGPVSGEVTVPVTAGENVAKVEIFVDGQLLGSAGNAPYTIRMPLSGIGRGTHDLWAQAATADGRVYITPPIPLEVIVAPEVTRVTPDHTLLAGGTTHRIVGTGFQPNCAVRLAGLPAHAVTYISPNLLEVTTDPGPAQRGAVEVTNPDGSVGTLQNGFEYYTPKVTDVRIRPVRDVLAPGHSAAYGTSCFDQFGHPLPAQVNWSASAGTITPDGRFTAPAQAGNVTLRVTHPDHPAGWTLPITVGPTPVPDGRLRHWLILGGFPDTDGEALLAPQIPEETVTPSHGEQIAERTWQSVYAQANFVDFVANCTPNTNAVAYAHTYLHIANPTEANLVLGSDDGIKIWLNGQAIFTQHIRRAADPNQNTVPITLQAGWNRLLVKVDQGNGGWGFFMRLQTRDGKPLGGVTCGLDAPTPTP